jgi:hypothetical protein
MRSPFDALPRQKLVEMNSISGESKFSTRHSPVQCNPRRHSGSVRDARYLNGLCAITPEVDGMPLIVDKRGTRTEQILMTGGLPGLFAYRSAF